MVNGSMEAKAETAATMKMDTIRKPSASPMSSGWRRQTDLAVLRGGGGKVYVAQVGSKAIQMTVFTRTR